MAPSLLLSSNPHSRTAGSGGGGRRGGPVQIHPPQLRLSKRGLRVDLNIAVRPPRHVAHSHSTGQSTRSQHTVTAHSHSTQSQHTVTSASSPCAHPTATPAGSKPPGTSATASPEGALGSPRLSTTEKL